MSISIYYFCCTTFDYTYWLLPLNWFFYSDNALRTLIGIEEPEDIPPSAEETSQSWLGSLFGTGGTFNPTFEVSIQEKPTIEKGPNIFNEKEKDAIKGGFKSLFGKGGFFNPIVKQ